MPNILNCPSTAAVHILEDSSVVCKITLRSFPSKSSFNLYLRSAYKYSFVYSLLQVLLQSYSFVFWLSARIYNFSFHLFI